MTGDEWCWEELTAKCRSVQMKWGAEIKIPSDVAYNPVEVFDETDVDKNVFRFVIYILWLEQQPDAFRKYLEVREKHSRLWSNCVYEVWQL